MTSVVFPRAIKVYEYMEAHAESVDAKEYFRYDLPFGVQYVQVWRGFTREISDALNFSKHLADAAITKLIAVESIRRVALGSHGAPSIFILLVPPTLELFESLRERSLVTGRISGVSPTQKLNDAISRLTNRVNELTQRIERLELVQQNAQVRRTD